ncbi:MAG: hypothetical protein JOY61_25300 [Chloroflexi bacterium]|nr:hypothetical protein [Chloroflexota bacterium]
MALATLFQFIRPASPEDHEAQQLFRGDATRLVDRLRVMFEEWGAMREFVPEYDKLANVAAVNRWELMRLAHESEQLHSPRSMAATQRELHEALTSGARAWQLLANGYRFHKSEAVCDGQALLIDTLAQVDRLIQQVQMH